MPRSRRWPAPRTAAGRFLARLATRARVSLRASRDQVRAGALRWPDHRLPRPQTSSSPIRLPQVRLRPARRAPQLQIRGQSPSRPDPLPPPLRPLCQLQVPPLRLPARSRKPHRMRRRPRRLRRLQAEAANTVTAITPAARRATVMVTVTRRAEMTRAPRNQAKAPKRRQPLAKCPHQKTMAPTNPTADSHMRQRVTAAVTATATITVTGRGSSGPTSRLGRWPRRCARFI